MEKELPKRKPTRLRNFDYSSGGAYFVTICIQDRKRILSEIVKNTNVPVGDGASTSRIIGASTSREINDKEIPQINLMKTGKIVEKHLLSSNNISGVKIDQYVIMPDHIHVIIILNPKEYADSHNMFSNVTSVSPIMRDVEAPIMRDVEAPSPTNEMLPRVISAFKKLCNKEIGYNIFQRGYFDHIIRDKEDYETRRKYISENPMRWYYKNM